MPRFIWRVVVSLGTAYSAYGIDLRYWIEPCTRPETSCQKADVQLAEWAFAAWQAASDGKLRLEKTDQLSRANIRLHWADSEQGQYGETRPFVTDGMRGAEVFVRPDLRAMGPEIFSAATQDSLLRDTIVYLTCLHETGHALFNPRLSPPDDHLPRISPCANDLFCLHRRSRSPLPAPPAP